MLATSALDLAPGTRQSNLYQTESGWQSDEDAVFCDGLKMSFEQEYVDSVSTDKSDIDEEIERANCSPVCPIDNKD